MYADEVTVFEGKGGNLQLPDPKHGIKIHYSNNDSEMNSSLQKCSFEKY